MYSRNRQHQESRALRALRRSLSELVRKQIDTLRTESLLVGLSDRCRQKLLKPLVSSRKLLLEQRTLIEPSQFCRRKRRRVLPTNRTKKDITDFLLKVEEQSQK